MKILRGRSTKGLFGKSAKDLNLPQAAFIAGLPQSPIVYTPYTNTGALKDDLSLGMKRKDFVLFSMYREKLFRKRNMKKPKLRLEKTFTNRAANVNTEGYLYYTVLDKAVEIVMDLDMKKLKLIVMI